jgi:chromate reductase, NAD(P)H dehydrogenase (quinone)
VHVLGICGSLRAASSNARLLAAAQILMPHGVEMHVTSCVERLPLFNPDVAPEESAIVREWVREMRAADGIVVSTPEYARGYPGALKNAFDWLVSTDAYVNKPFMLLNASSRSIVAQQTLTTVLETMSGVHIESASVTIPLLGTSLDIAGILADREFASAIETSDSRFVAELKRRAIELQVPAPDSQ